MFTSQATFARHGLNRRSHGFTLVEILIVVVILGILAAIVLPTFSSAADEARENAVQMDLHRIRVQLEVYKQQHNGDYPALATIVDQLTLSTNAAGQTAAIGTAGFPFGPYLRDVPKNPATGGRTIGAGEVGSSDWYYNETTGEFLANDSELARTF